MKKTNRIRVKFCTDNPRLWLRQFPDENPVWGECEFIFDRSSRDYDWYVVYNDFPGAFQEETLACPCQQTLLVTTEPPSIKSYGKDFTRQFGAVLTSQPEWSLPHQDRIFSQPALHWFYGWGSGVMRSYDEIAACHPVKSQVISTVCSSKKQRHTLHNRRYRFTQYQQGHLEEIDVFGHGVRSMDDKAEALDAYHYHLAIENYQGCHHWTEKLADAFLGECLPFYFGCPNIADYFPEESFILIDLFDPGGSCEVIQRAMRDNEYSKRLRFIIEAKQRVLKEYNLFAVLNREISARQASGLDSGQSEVLFSRRSLRKKNPQVAVNDFIEKNRVRFFSLLGR